MEKSLPWLLCFNFLWSNAEGAGPVKEGIVEWWLGRKRKEGMGFGDWRVPESQVLELG